MVAVVDSDDPRIAYMATNTALERAWGKPKEYDPHAEKEPSLSTPEGTCIGGPE
jgi:hypothetical protein